MLEAYEEGDGRYVRAPGPSLNRLGKYGPILLLNPPSKDWFHVLFRSILC